MSIFINICFYLNLEYFNYWEAVDLPTKSWLFFFSKSCSSILFGVGNLEALCFVCHYCLNRDLRKNSCSTWGNRKVPQTSQFLYCSNFFMLVLTGFSWRPLHMYILIYTMISKYFLFGSLLNTGFFFFFTQWI